MLRSSLCDYSDAYILASCISRINNAQVDDVQYIHVVMSMYNLIECSDGYCKTSGILWQYCRDELAVNDNGEIVDFIANNANTNSFEIKQKITDQTANNGTTSAEIMLPLKYLSNFRRTLEMPIINCEISLDLNWYENYVIVATNVTAQATTFSITDTKPYVLVVTLSSKDNVKPFTKLKPGFKRTVNWNKYQPKVSTDRMNQYLDFLIYPSFQGLNRIFVLPFQHETQRTSYKRYYLSTVEIEKYNVMIDEQNFFDQPI